MGTVKVLIIDHYDSYTNNILQLLQGSQTGQDGSTYPEWSVAVVRFDQFDWDTFKTELLPSLDAIILSPGPGTPERESDFGFNSRLIKEVDIPILGICLGHQGIGTSLGATIINTPNIKHGQTAEIHHKAIGVLRDLPQRFWGVRYNSLVLDIELPPELEATAWTYDPEDSSRKVLMGLQHRRRPIFGTQWHPESVCSEHGAKILSNFRDIVLSYWATSRPANQWTSRSILPNATLPSHILNADVLLDEAHHSFESTTLRGVSVDGQNTPYYVASASLGKGPKPELVFQSLIRGSSADGEAWLDSAKVRDSHSRNSYLASAAFSLSYSIELGTVSVHQGGRITKSERLRGTYWHWLDHFQHELVLKNTQAILPESLNQDAEVGQPLLQVGFIGYFGYELKWESLPGHRYPDAEVERHDRPDSQLIFADRVLRLDNYTGEWTLFGLIRRGEHDPIGQAIEATSAIGLDEDEFADLVSRFRDSFDGLPSPPYGQPHPLPEFVALDNQDSYTSSIVQAKKAISEGETYELTLTTKFLAKSPDADPFALYLDLRGRNPAPYSAFLHFPAHDTTILSSSPERFISIDRNGVAEMKPIKGTLAVSSDPEEDLRRRNKLATDVKELAENLMIVDLIRSDLHNVSPSSSIKVPKLLHVETYQTVHQVSPPLAPAEQVDERCFPPGSMTGAPKLRSVQILEQLEQQRRRGVYSGSLGYVCVSGTVDQSVVIRTIVKTGDELELGAGGAITWLSESEKEWEEVMVKANAVARRQALSSRTLGLRLIMSRDITLLSAPRLVVLERPRIS
ncbi:hypothetical protein VTJ83DRAFT_6990 [Remersonia thermophila]|uniref:aminodeoxychorismate synthase n=1 Tax=Remersonia thermophila TaxID=72144 RepID=A0ABR4D730_9PEZI